MKVCPYCGKEYPDDATVCAIDQFPLELPAQEQAPKTEQHGRARSSDEDATNFIIKAECHDDSLIAICNAVSKTNKSCTEYTFGVNRAWKVEIHGREFCIVFGDVGTLTLQDGLDFRGGWSRWESLYALAESEEQISWMSSNPEVFTPVSEDSAFPVFWVKLDKQKFGISRFFDGFG